MTVETDEDVAALKRIGCRMFSSKCSMLLNLV